MLAAAFALLELSCMGRLYFPDTTSFLTHTFAARLNVRFHIVNPGYPLFLDAVCAVAPPSARMLLLVLLQQAATVATPWFVRRAGELAGHPRSGLVAAFATALHAPLPLFAQTAQTDGPFAVFFTLTLFLVARAGAPSSAPGPEPVDDRRRRAGRWMLAGATAAAAVSIRSSGVALFAAIVVALIASGPRRNLRALVAAALGFSLMGGLVKLKNLVDFGESSIVQGEGIHLWCRVATLDRRVPDSPAGRELAAFARELGHASPCYDQAGWDLFAELGRRRHVSAEVADDLLRRAALDAFAEAPLDALALTWQSMVEAVGTRSPLGYMLNGALRPAGFARFEAQTAAFWDHSPTVYQAMRSLLPADPPRATADDPRFAFIERWSAWSRKWCGPWILFALVALGVVGLARRDALLLFASGAPFAQLAASAIGDKPFPGHFDPAAPTFFLALAMGLAVLVDGFRRRGRRRDHRIALTILATAAVAIAGTAPTATAQEFESIDLVGIEHLDVGFTASPQGVLSLQKAHLDHALKLCEERPDFCWTVESLLQLEQWLEQTPDAATRQRLVALVRAGRIEVAGGVANFHTGVMDETLLRRAFARAGATRTALDIPITGAIQDDVPGFSSLLPSVLAASDLHWFLAGVNTSFGGGTSLAPRDDPFWWEGPDGQRVLAWFAPGGYLEADEFGLSPWAPAGDAEQKIPKKLADLRAAGYRRGRVLVMAGTGDNGDPDGARATVQKVDAWNARHERPKLRFTTPGTFLGAIAAAPDSSSLPVARGGGAGHWEAVKAAAPGATGRFRHAQALLPAVDAAVQTNRGTAHGDVLARDVDEAVRRLVLYAEHSQPGGVGWPNLTTVAEVDAANRFASSLANSADDLLVGVLRDEVRRAAPVAPPGPRIAVFNPVPFPRTDCVEAEVPLEVAAAGFRLLDRDGVAVPSEFDAPTRRLRFVVKDLAGTATAWFTLAPPRDESSPQLLAGAPARRTFAFTSPGRVAQITEADPQAGMLGWFDPGSPWRFGDLAWMRPFNLGGDLLRVDPGRFAPPAESVDADDRTRTVAVSTDSACGRSFRFQSPDAPRPEVAFREIDDGSFVEVDLTIDVSKFAALTGYTAAGDPGRIYLPLPLRDSGFPAGGARRARLTWTTAAGVESSADFLPGARPRRVVTTGALRLTIGASEGGATDEFVVLLREPFDVELASPGWIGDADPAEELFAQAPPLLWIHLLDHARFGETKDQGRVAFATLEPDTGPLRTVHVGLRARRLAGVDAACSDAELLRLAARFRAPLLAFVTPR